MQQEKKLLPKKLQERELLRDAEAEVQEADAEDNSFKILNLSLLQSCQKHLYSKVEKSSTIQGTS